MSVHKDPLAPQAQHWARIYFNIAAVPFWAVHVGAVVGIAVTGWSWSGLAFSAALYVIRMFFVTGAYHRYFSHRSYKTSRPMQFVLGLGATTAVQKGPLWWAAHHRVHHKYSDQPGDVHSPVVDGFWWSHMGWILCRDLESTNYSRVSDLSRYPELVWLNRLSLVPPIALGFLFYYLGGGALVSWYLLSTALLWHGTFTINSLSHVIGRRRYETSDDSRNNWLLALVTLGEGWHNNHHYYQSSCRQGFRWYEVDLTYYGLRALALVGLIWDVRVPPTHVVEGQPRRNGSEQAPASGLRKAVDLSEAA